MAFSTETQALLALGYGLVSINNGAITFPSGLGVDGLALVSGILTDLQELDLELSENISNSMAVKVQDLGLSYPQYVALASAKGSRLLERLAVALDTPVVYDKYKNNSKAGGAGIAVRNYY